MRRWFCPALFLAGCLHAQGPARGKANADPESLKTFTGLVNGAETIDDAQAFAEARGFTRADWIGPADAAYWSFMRAEVYAPAAEIAWRFGFGKSAVALALSHARDASRKAEGAYLRKKDAPERHGRLFDARRALAVQAQIACRYGGKKDAAEAVEDTDRLRHLSGDDKVLMPLLDEGCPVDAIVRDAAIRAARLGGDDAFAIRHAAAAGWDSVKVSQFLWEFFLYNDCTDGIPALVAFKVTPVEGARIVQQANCEDEAIDAGRWSLTKEASNAWFFAAVRGMNYNLAIALLSASALGADGATYLYQEAARNGVGLMMKPLKRSAEHHEGFMAYLWEQGRFRSIANFSLSAEWQRKAFDKLLELKKWEDAAEAAEYGVSEAFRKEGVVLAFRAAMAAGDFKAGRYFVYRYGPTKKSEGLVTQEMYDEEKDKWYAAKQAAGDPEWMKKPAVKKKPKKRKKKSGRKKPPCPDDDWCP